MATIRPTIVEDVTTLVELTRATGFFRPLEVDTLKLVFDDYFAGEQEQGHRCVTLAEGNQLLGFAYYAPTPMTIGTWHLYWIVVKKTDQARGLGTQLLHHVEDAIRAADGRVLFIETSGLPHYDPTRRFYLKNGYEQTAVLREFYARGDDMVVFCKKFAAPALDA